MSWAIAAIVIYFWGDCPVDTVLNIDSGSDKSFDFLGNARVIQWLKELILEIWDRVVFYRERKTFEKLELIGKALPILERINLSETDGTISPEQAEI